MTEELVWANVMRPRIPLYADYASAGNREHDSFAFVTSNSDDFSLPNGDQREPHPDIADLFGDDGSRYGLGVEGLNIILIDHFGAAIEGLFEETYYEEEPRKLAEVASAEQEHFDRIWYHRSKQHEYELADSGDETGVGRLLRIAGPGRA